MTWLGETTPEPSAVPQRLSDRHRDLRRRCWSRWSWRRSARASSIRGSTGRRSSPRRPAARRSPISPTARSGIGYPGGSLLLLACVLLSLFAWYRTLGTVDVNSDQRRRSEEAFYWSRSPSRRRSAPRLATGARLDGRGLGYSGGALVFGAALALLAILYFATKRQPRLPVLGGLHPDAAARRDRRRFPRQAGRARADWPSAGRSLRRSGGRRSSLLILLIPQRPGSHPGNGGSAA